MLISGLLEVTVQDGMRALGYLRLVEIRIGHSAERVTALQLRRCWQAEWFGCVARTATSGY